MEPMTVSELQAIIADHIDKLWEVHQQEIDRRFDRLQRRLSQAEHTIADVDRKIAESELAIRKNVDELLDRLPNFMEFIRLLPPEYLELLPPELRGRFEPEDGPCEETTKE